MGLGLYKHSNGKDLAFKITACTRVENGYEVYGQWVNIVNPRNHFPIDVWEHHYISNEKAKNWEKYE